MYFRSTGGIEAEQAMRTKLNEEDQNNIMESVYALMKLPRKKRGQIIPSTKKDDNGGYEAKVYEKDFTDSLIVSKNYYDECISSDGDSADESVIKPNQLVYEINSESSSEVYSNSESDVSEQLQPQSTTIDITCKKYGDCQIDVDQVNENDEHLVNINIDTFQNNIVEDTKNISENISFEMYTDSIEEIKYTGNNDIYNESNLEKCENDIKKNVTLSDNKNDNKDNNGEHSYNLTDIMVKNNQLLRDDNFENSKNLDINEKRITNDDSSILCPVQNEKTSHT